MTGSNIIGFSLSAEGEHSFSTSNPATGEFGMVRFSEATTSEIDRACQLADEAFRIFRFISFRDRSAFLLAIVQEMQAAQADLLSEYCRESGLGMDRAQSEFRRTIFQLNTFSEGVLSHRWTNPSIDTADPSRVPVKPDIRKCSLGIGPVVVFGASNFPFAYSTAGGDTASALAAGCPVIVKAHPLHAGTSSLTAECVTRAARRTGMPDGVFSHLHAESFRVGEQLVQDPRVKAVGFTGSIAGGRALFDLASQRPEPIPVFAEMGSVNPVLVFPELLEEKMDYWSELLAVSMNSGVGQFCTNPGLIFLLESDNTTQFISRLSDRFLGAEAQVMLHQTIHDRFEKARQELKAVRSVKWNEKQGQLSGNFARQTIMQVTGQRFREEPTLQNEVFGPFSVIVICQSIGELESCLDQLHGQLTASVFGSNKELSGHKPLLSKLEEKVGRIIFNGVPTGVEVCTSMQHGGPYPSSTDSRFTAVGSDAVLRFVRSVSYQNCPQELLPESLRDINSLGILRRINGELTTKDVS